MFGFVSEQVCLHNCFSCSGEARIRVQLSAVHSRADVDRCIQAFVDIGKRKGVLQ